MPDITITPVAYGPQESDENPGVYLQRCGEALLAAHGYSYTLLAEEGVRQLQINIPDEEANGGRRAVRVLAPQVLWDVDGTLLSDEQFTAKYGES